MGMQTGSQGVPLPGGYTSSPVGGKSTAQPMPAAQPMPLGSMPARAAPAGPAYGTPGNAAFGGFPMTGSLLSSATPIPQAPAYGTAGNAAFGGFNMSPQPQNTAATAPSATLGPSVAQQQRAAQMPPRQRGGMRV
jgi:hypothetical protein